MRWNISWTACRPASARCCRSKRLWPSCRLCSRPRRRRGKGGWWRPREKCWRDCRDCTGADGVVAVSWENAGRPGGPTAALAGGGPGAPGEAGRSNCGRDHRRAGRRSDCRALRPGAVGLLPRERTGCPGPLLPGRRRQPRRRGRSHYRRLPADRPRSHRPRDRTLPERRLRLRGERVAVHVSRRARYRGVLFRGAGAGVARGEKPSDREHVTPYLRAGQFRVANVENDAPEPGEHRWTVDHPADLEFVRQIYAAFARNGRFGYRDVFRLLRERPELASLQVKTISNKGYFKSLYEQAKAGAAPKRGIAKSQAWFARASKVIPGAAQTFSKG